MTTFSEHAYKKLIDLYTTHDKQVGSHLYKTNPSKYDALGLKPTDCITYVIHCLKAGFDGVGDSVAVGKVGNLGEYGTELAKYLVNTKKWKGIHINPDEVHPRDGQDEHSYASYIARKKCQYYRIPMKYKVTNYKPTEKTDPKFKTVNPHRGVTALDTINYNALAKVKFAFGLSRGGMHTWLFSEGKVYEVHYDQLPTGQLYEATALKKFGYLSGAIIVPPDQEKKLATLSGLSCSGS